MKHLTFLIIFLLFIPYLFLYSQKEPPLNYPLTKENLAECKEYIYSKAPANKRLKFAINLVSVYNFTREYQKSVKLGLELIDAFNNDKDQHDYFLNIIRQYSQMMLTINPQPEDFDIFHKFILDNKDSYQAITAIKRLAANYTNAQKWDSAAGIWQQYIGILPEYKDEIEKTINILKSPIRGLSVNLLGEGINTSGDEWDPNPSFDGKYLYYSASHRSGGKGNSDIWMAEFIDGVWKNPKNFDAGVNSPKNETIDNVSLDGNTLLLSGNFEGTYGNFDIYFLERNASGWGALRHLPRPINSEYTDEAANLSADGQVLLFSSDRPGGIGEFRAYNSSFYNGNNMGNMDIYVSLKKDGKWTEPINLGSKINTPFAERSPYLHPDGKTLYFSSDGHYGLGGLDVFVTKRLSDTSWTEWSEPVNLGKEINSILDDWGYKISIGGDSAFFSAYNRTIGKGGWDLFSITLPEEIKPDKVLTIKGKIIDEAGKAVFAKVVWEDLELNKTLGELSSNPETGEFLVVASQNKLFGYYVEKEGYYPNSAFLDLRNKIKDNEINIEIKLIKESDFNKGESIIINNLFFDFNSSIIKKESYPELNRLVNFLKKNETSIEVIGHTDSDGDNNYNLDLSFKRANAVKEYLIRNGILSKRIIAKGMGETQPLKPNDSDINKSINRRVEIKKK